MYIDKYFNITEYEFLFSSYINTQNYVSVDSAYLSQVNFFVRKSYIEGQPYQTGYTDELDRHTSATI